MLFAISDEVWLALIAAFVTILTGIQTLILAWMQSNTRKSIEKAGRETAVAAHQAADKAEEVKETFERRTVDVDSQFKAIADTTKQVRDAVDDLKTSSKLGGGK